MSSSAASAASNAVPSDQSKISGNIKSIAGGVQELVGSATGFSGVESDGAALKAKGDTEYKVSLLSS